MRERFERFEKYMNFKQLNDNQVTQQCNLSVGLINQARRGKSDLGSRTIEKILNTYQDLSKSWLLTGEGQMIKNESVKPTLQNVIELPLLPVDALAGKLTGTDISVMEYDCEKYIIPAFKGAEYLVRVSGVSMMPQYMPGDIVACKPVVMDNLWFQWGKTYVLATNQGVLIKRIEQSQTTGCVTLRSYNPDYAPFDLPAEEIHGVSLVVGLVRVE